MITQHTVEAAASAAGFTGSARFLPTTGSTNSDLLRLARQGAPSWSVLVAGHQEGGRGRLGRSWVAPPGSSLLVSVLIRPSARPTAAALMTLGAGLALARAVRAACRIEVTCKWPNDVLASERKLGGILTEAEVEGQRTPFVVIGTGVNVTQAVDDFPTELRAVATSVGLEGGRTDMAMLLGAYLSELRLAADPDVPGFASKVLEAYRPVCSTIGREVAATTLAGDRVRGIAVEVDDSGRLVVRTGSGPTAVAFGEVEHLR